MAAGCAEIALALALLPVFCGRFQAVAHRNLYPSVIQWRHCCLIYEKAGSATAHPSPRKGATRPAGRGWVAPGAWEQQREGGDVLFLLAKMYFALLRELTNESRVLRFD
jgi:hypothetical protein